MTMRVPLQAGNWKCNPLSVEDAVTLANEVTFICVVRVRAGGDML